MTLVDAVFAFAAVGMCTIALLQNSRAKHLEKQLELFRKVMPPVPAVQTVAELLADNGKMVDSFEWYARSEMPQRTGCKVQLTDGTLLGFCMTPMQAHTYSDDALRAAAGAAKRVDGRAENARAV